MQEEQSSILTAVAVQVAVSRFAEHGRGDFNRRSRRGLNFGPAVEKPNRLLFDQVGGIENTARSSARLASMNGKNKQGSQNAAR